MSRAKKPDLMNMMEEGLSKILGDPNTTAKERMDAIGMGIKLTQAKHKIKDPDEGKEGHFFGG